MTVFQLRDRGAQLKRRAVKLTLERAIPGATSRGGLLEGCPPATQLIVGSFSILRRRVTTSKEDWEESPPKSHTATAAVSLSSQAVRFAAYALY